MATTPNPLIGSSGASGAPPTAPGVGVPAPASGAGTNSPLPQRLARLAMDAQQISSESPETAPMMREIQNQVRMAMMKMIQQRQSAQQATPPI